MEYNQDLIRRAINHIREVKPDMTARQQIDSASVAIRLCQLLIGNEEREHFAVLFLDSQHRLVKDEIMFSGTVNSAAVYPREVIKRALELNAVSIILSHNHPSGECEPSNADENITKQIQRAAELFDITVLDHVIVGPTSNHVSFATRGLI